MKPYVICHMLQSLDGKVTGNFLNKKECEESCQLYYKMHLEYQSDAFCCGRVTMETSFTNCYYPDLKKYMNKKVSKVDYIGEYNKRFFAIAFDRYGKLGLRSSTIIDLDPGYNDAHIIEVLTEDVKDEYLLYLQDIGVSYIFAGKNDIDISFALEKLNNLFGIKKILLEGGSIINRAFNDAKVMDELSLVVAPTAFHLSHFDILLLFLHSISKMNKFVLIFLF